MPGLATGTKLAGYRIEALLGEGGMGAVYRARQLKLERAVALKVIAARLAGDPQFRERFRREATAAASIEHPHVVPVFEADECAGRLFIAMRLIDGVDLASLIWHERQLEPHRALHLIEQVASALDAAHARGLVHRDVKPANVLVDVNANREHAYLTDFGVAKRYGSETGLTKTGSVVGTLDYLPPEAFRGEPVGPAGDVYALGCVLYEALAGEVPFPGESEAAKVSGHLYGSPPSLLDYVPGLPVGVDETVRRALAKDLSRRFESAGRLAEEALAALKGGASATIVDASSKGHRPVAGEPLRKSVTVLYTMLAGSPGEPIDPELRVQVLPEFSRRGREAIERHGGVCADSVGDAIVGVFGLPALHEDDALRAARAALDLHEAVAVQGAGSESGPASLVPISAIVTDEVIAGDPAGDLEVAGGVVQAAARLCQVGEPGQIMLSDASRQLVGDAVEFERLPAGSERGQPALWRLRAVVPEPLRRRFDAPLVGREQELLQLRQTLGRVAQDRSARLITVLGAPGLGKSRLAREFQRSVEREATVVVGRCLPYGEDIVFSPIAEAVRQLAGPDPLEGIRRILALDPDAGAIGARLGELLGLAEGLAGTDETFWAVRRFLAAAAAERALVAVFEDIHWGEPTLLDLIEHLAEWGRGVPLLLVCLARPELLDACPGWSGGRVNSTSILLEPLSTEESEALIDGAPGGALLDAATRRRILEAAEGNPLFVEQMLALVRDQVAPVGDVPVPASIKALLAARLGRLGSPERGLLARASIVGKEFSVRAVQPLLEKGGGIALPDVIAGLVRKDFIEPAAGTSGRDEFRFRHMLIRDAAYEALPKRLRGELHERFANWLEKTSGEGRIEHDEIVGSHLERAYRYRCELSGVGTATAELADRAAERLGAAGRLALARSDPRAAIDLLDRATGVLDRSDPRRPGLRLDVAVALGERGEFARAETVVDEVIDAADRHGEPRLRYRALVQRSFIALSEGAPQGELAETALAAIGALKELGDDLGLAQAWLLLGLTRWGACQAGSAGFAFEHAVDYARRAGARREEDEGIGWMLAARSFGPTPVAEVIAQCEQVLADAPERRRIQGHVFSFHLSLMKALEGHFDEARAIHARGQAIDEELGLDVWVASNTQAAGMIEMHAGNAAAAEDALRWGYEALDRLGEKALLSTNAAMLAQALEAQRNHAEAERFLWIAETAAAPDDIGAQLDIRTARARLLAATGAYAQAEQAGREALELASSTDFFWHGPDARLALAAALRASGRGAEAHELVAAALELQVAKGNVAAARRTRKLLSSLR